VQAKFSKLRNDHLELGNPDHDVLSVFVLAQIETLGGAVGIDEVIVVIMELVAWREAGELAHDTVAFNHEFVTLGIGDDPFATEDGDDAVAFVSDSDIIAEAIGAVGWVIRVGEVFNPVHAYRESRNFLVFGSFSHRRKVNQQLILVKTASG